MIRTAGRRLLPFAVLLGVWEAAELVAAARFPVVPSPGAIVGTLVASRVVLMSNLQTTAFEAVAGFVIGNVLGVVLATSFVLWRRAERAVYNLVVAVHSIPLIAIAPLFILWFGSGSAPQVAVAALACFFPTAVMLSRGFKAVDPSSADLMLVLGASRWQALRLVVLPTSLPYFVAAMKLAAPAAVLGATVGEWLGTGGLGYLLFSSMVNFQVPLLWATMFVSAFLAMAGFLAFEVAELLAPLWYRRATRGTGP